MDKYYTTRRLLGARRAALWRQFISETFVELDCKNMSRDDFFGELRARTLGDLGITAITTDAYDVFRTDQSISKSTDDAFIVSLQTAGSATIRQLDREVVLRPGDFTIYDSRMPYHLHFGERLSQLVVKVPRERFKAHFQSPETLTALHIKGFKGIARVTTSFARTLFDQSNALGDAHQSQLADTFIELLTSSIREATSQLEREPRNKSSQLLRIKRYIAQNLRDPELDLASIADAHGISDRYVHTLFDAETVTPSRFIWNERVRAARDDLRNPLLGHHSISEICFSWGFSDAAHFSRAFKSRYEQSPRTFRKAALGSI